MFRALFKKLAQLAPNCREAARWQSAALDQPLGLLPRLGLRIHLAMCKWCRRYGKQIEFLRTISQRPEEQEKAPPPQTLTLAARERIKRRLHEENRK